MNLFSKTDFILACPQDFDNKHGVVLIISFSDLKLLEHLVDYTLFSIIIDCFDEIAKKPIIKKLSGDFHIGLTTRNFYVSTNLPVIEQYSYNKH